MKKTKKQNKTKQTKQNQIGQKNTKKHDAKRDNLNYLQTAGIKISLNFSTARVGKIVADNRTWKWE